MSRAGITAAILALAAISFWWFPGHSILQSDTQIYIPVLEHLYDNSVLAADIMAVRGHVQWTLFDELVFALRRLTGLGFEPVLLTLQLLTRLAGIVGIYLIASKLVNGRWRALAVTAIVSLGALVHGPTVLTVEYEPVPRGFGLQLGWLALGYAVQGQATVAAIVAAIALTMHPPSAGPVFVLLAGWYLWCRNGRVLLILLSGVLLLVWGWSAQPSGPEQPSFFATISPELEIIQQSRSSYNWVSLWWDKWLRHYLVVASFAAIALWRLRRKIPDTWIRIMAAGCAIGAISPFVSLLLLEWMKLLGAAQLQPARYLLLLTAVAVFACAVVGMNDRLWWVRAALLTFAFAVPMNPDVTLLEPVQVGVAATLGLLTAIPKTAFVPALAAFLYIPLAGDVRPIPPLHTENLNALAAWARTSTPSQAVFQFADVRRGLQPGVFRARALRAIYADWKAGGQANFLPEFAAEWWKRWHVIKEPKRVAFYRDLGIDYVVYTKKGAPAGAPSVYSNADWTVIATGYRLLK